VQNVLFLIKNGIPFDVAFSLEPAELKAWGIVFNQFEGARYDWKSDSWEPMR
jgi:hypothetical protein